MRNLSAFWLLLAAGCSSYSSVEGEARDGGGTAVVYEIGKEDALRLAKETLKSYGPSEVKEGKDSVTAYFNTNLITPGSFCGVFVGGLAGGRSEVRAVSQRASSISIFTCLTESTFHDEYAKRVAKLKRAEILKADQEAGK